MAKVDISRLLKKAEEAFNRRNYGLAIVNYIQALTLQPDHLEARKCLRATQTRYYNETGGNVLKLYMGYLKAQMFALLSKHEQAMLACEQALMHNPNHVALLQLLATCAAALEMNEVAAWQRQEIADRHDRENIANLQALAELYLAMGKGNDAIRCLERMREIDPNVDIDAALRDAAATTMTSTFEKAVEEGARSVLKDQEQTEQLDLDSSRLRTDEARRKSIQYILEHDAKERPNDHRIYLRLGDICFDMEDWAYGYAQAKEYYLKAQELNSTDHTVRDRLGDLEIKAMRLAIEKIEEQCRERPNDAALQGKLKEARQKRLQFELAEYERRVKAQPLKAAFHNRLGEIYFQVGRYEEAIAELQQAARDPKFKISGLTLLGRCFHATNQFDMAIAQFQKAREGQELFEKIKDSLYYEATTWESKGDLASLRQALALCTKIYETDIAYRDVRRKVPELQAKIKKLEKA